MRNVLLDRLTARLLDAAINLNEAAEHIEDREAITLAEVEDLKHTISAAARSLDFCSLTLTHMEADCISPGGVSAEVIATRNAAQAEAALLAVIHDTLRNGKTA